MEATLEARIINLETIIAQQDRTIDALNAEILRLNQLHEHLVARFEAAESRRESEGYIRALADEVPPPHY